MAGLVNINNPIAEQLEYIITLISTFDSEKTGVFIAMTPLLAQPPLKKASHRHVMKWKWDVLTI